MTKTQQFVTIVQTASIVKELSGEAARIGKLKGKTISAASVVGKEMVVSEFIPETMGAQEASFQFLGYIYEEEIVSISPDWMLESGL